MAGEEETPNLNIVIKDEQIAGIWANWAAVSHSPYEFTIDFARLDFNQNPVSGIIVERVNLSPLFVTQLIEALQSNWDKYAKKAMPIEMSQNDPDDK